MKEELTGYYWDIRDQMFFHLLLSVFHFVVAICVAASLATHVFAL